VNHRLIIFVLLLFSSAALAQAPKPSRADVARRFMEFDRRYIAAWEMGLVTPENRHRFNAEFDAVTNVFMRKRDPARAILMLDALTARLPEASKVFIPDINTQPLPGFDQHQIDLLKQLDALGELSVSKRNALAARIRLLKDVPSQTTSAEYLTDRPTLLRQLQTELLNLKSGKAIPPQTGTFWTVFSTPGGSTLPAYVHVPTTLKSPAPVVVAFHGMAVDESMFVFGYGAGALRRLADQHGFVLVSPNTFVTLGQGNVLPSILDQLDVPIDRPRVYIVGHSLGAVCAWGVVNQQPESIRAVGLIGAIVGPSTLPTQVPPTRLVLGEFDHLFPVARATSRTQELQRQGVRFELHVVPNAGHTLVAGEELPALLEWMLAQ
jgi:dienelactone hydrolase